MKSLALSFIVIILLLPTQLFAIDGADLVVEDVMLDQNCVPTAKITNIGNMPLPTTAYDSAPNGYRVDFKDQYGGQVYKRLIDVDPDRKLLQAGGTTTFPILPTPFEETVSFYFSLDLDKKFPEANHENNQKWISKTCTKYPPDGRAKLQVVDFNLTTNCNLQVTLKNVGQGNLSFANYYGPSWPHGRKISLSGVGTYAIELASVREIDPNLRLREESGVATGIIDISRILGFSRDNPIPEKKDITLTSYPTFAPMNDLIDRKTKSLFCGPDLDVTLELAPAIAYVGERVSVKVTIKNVGFRPSAPTRFALQIQNRDNASIHNVRALQPNESIVMAESLENNIAGDIAIVGNVDYESQVDEISEENNTERIVLTTVKPGAPDIAVLDLAVDTPVRLGKPVEISAKIKNTGAANVAYNYEIRILGESTPYFGTTAVTHPGEIITVKRTVTFNRTGNVQIVAIADPQNRIAESNENNNNKVVSVTVMPF